MWWTLQKGKSFTIGVSLGFLALDPQGLQKLRVIKHAHVLQV